MKHPVFPARLGLLPLACFAAFPAWPQARTYALNDVVVTATRSASAVDELVSDVTVISRETIENSTARTLPELLARSAGLQFSSSGGLGKTSSVFVRGTENRHTILLVDGVRLGSATTGNPTWDNIPLDMIERIEVLKGPASALYGSEGVGGVVQVFTRKGSTGFHPNASATAGSVGHRQLAAGASGGQGALGYSVGVQRTREQGFSATNARVPFGSFNPDPDGFSQDAVNASLQYRLSPDWRIDAGLLHSEGRNEFDDGPGRDAREVVRSQVAHVGVKGRLLPAWQSELTLARSEDVDDSVVAAFPGEFRTQQRQWTWQNTVDSPLGIVLAGLEQRLQKVDSSTAYVATRRTINSAFAGINGSSGPHSWQANLRRDDNSQFGANTTGFIGYGLRIAPAWRLSASHGTSFVAPSFNQLYYPDFGNPLLQPERGRNTDVALTWTAPGQEVRLVRFDNRIRGYMTSTTVPTNIPQSRIDGWTLGYDGRFGRLALRASLDRLDPRNELTGAQLPRRAKEQLALGADWEQGAWRYGASLLHVGERFDDVANTAPLAPYSTVDVYADWKFAPAWSVQAKLNNLTDRQYETALGYNQAPRSFYLTLRWQPK
ncbi:TonB-dependent receptor domain-containing protein [Caenimonas terrae]|uniref:TonB-dependent receptor domain-containing protein n=1 Tax=Caenimonas terrae TaxID=696074 RepID=A0ABW0NAJ4_9BURK